MVEESIRIILISNYGQAIKIIHSDRNQLSGKINGNWKFIRFIEVINVNNAFLFGSHCEILLSYR